MLASLARRLRGGLDDETDPFELLIACQDHLVLAARAYADRLVLEAFADAVERAPEGERELLARLCDLHALHLFERERGWFQEHGRFSSTRSKAVIRARQRGVRGPRAARPPPGRRVRDPGDRAWPAPGRSRAAPSSVRAAGVLGRVERGPQRVGAEVRQRRGQRHRDGVGVAVLLAREAGLVAHLDEHVQACRAAPPAGPG